MDSFGDGVYAVCTPAISNIFPRRWFPPYPDNNALAGADNTGDYLDKFGNHITVLAVANPHLYPGQGLAGLRYRATGYSILRCKSATREVRIEVWPRWVDPSQSGARPYEGWPVTIRQLDNGLREAHWALNRIETRGIRDPVIQVRDASTAEIVYTVRASGDSFTPLVRQPGSYDVTVFDPDTGYRKMRKGVQARKR